MAGHMIGLSRDEKVSIIAIVFTSKNNNPSKT